MQTARSSWTFGASVVLARFAARSREEIAEDRERAERAQQARARVQDIADAARLGLGPQLHTHGDVLLRALALSEIEDAREERERQRRLEDRADRALERLAAAERQLAVERAAHSRTARLASDRFDGWAAERRRRQSDAAYQQSAYRTYYR